MFKKTAQLARDGFPDRAGYILMLMMACENMQVTFVVTGDNINSGGCSFLCNSPGSGPRGLGRDEGELVVGERSKGCYQRQGCLLQMVEIYALEINSHSPIHFKWHQN